MKFAYLLNSFHSQPICQRLLRGITLTTRGNTISRRVAGEVRQIDVYVVPNPTPTADRLALGNVGSILIMGLFLFYCRSRPFLLWQWVHDRAFLGYPKK
jgi:hypothetical protein